jgi:uncharacterized protein YkwD
MPSFRDIPIRRATAAALVVGMMLTIFPAATMASTSQPSEVTVADWDVLAEVNQVRANHGLGALRMDERVRDLATDRSRSMRDLDYFGHVQPNGLNAGDILRNRDISARYWGEIIGWTVNMDLTEGGVWMVDWWKNSPVHREIMLSPRFNYVGVGIAREGIKTIWTMVFTNQADHTPPFVGLMQPASAAGVRSVGSGTIVSAEGTTVRWWGRDRPLATRTSGLRSFSLQHRLPGGRWATLFSSTTLRQKTWDLRPGDHWFRVRATDNRGNRTRWMDPLHIFVP